MKRSLGFAALAAVSTLLAAISAHAQTTSLNSGSLGAAGNGTNAAGVMVQSPGAVGPGGDVGAGRRGLGRRRPEALRQWRGHTGGRERPRGLQREHERDFFGRQL